MSTPTSNHKSQKLACISCQQRKIKCDRSIPCNNCTKARINCLSRTPAPPRKRRRRNQDLQDRLSRCEELLSQYAHAGPPPRSVFSSPEGSWTPRTMASASEPQSRNDSGSEEDQAPRARPYHSGRMIQDDAGARFMDSHALVTILENLQAIRDTMDTEEPTNYGSPSAFAGSRPEAESDPLLGNGEDTTTDVQDLQPDPVHAFRLWKLFLERVNPLLKVVHIPTLQPYVLEGAASITNLEPKYQALIFAIYMISSISVSEAEALGVLGMPREEAVQRYMKGMKIALVRCDFIKNYDIVSLQALVLYVVTLHGRHDRHAAWVLSGTVMRIAQKMGYHRDGETLGLSPFETEMRRRIWWQLITRDFKYALMSGLTRSVLPVGWDTKRPSNINDSDIYPGLAEPVQERDKPTEMAFVLVIIEISKAMMIVTSEPGFESALIGQSLTYALGDEAQAAADLERYRLILQDLDHNLAEIERRFLDASAGNVHFAALTVRSLLLSRLPEMLEPLDPWLTSPQEGLMKMITNYLEQVADVTELMSQKNFTWYIEHHFDLETFRVLAGLLAECPDSSMADRAWQCLQVGYRQHPEIYDITQKDHHEQAVITLNAWQARVNAQAERGHPSPDPEPEFITRLKASVRALDPQERSSEGLIPHFLISETPSQRRGLDSLLSGYFDVSQFRREDVWNPALVLPSSGQTVPVTELGELSIAQFVDQH